MYCAALTSEQGLKGRYLKTQLQVKDKHAREAALSAAKAEILLPEQPGYAAVLRLAPLYAAIQLH